jgi:hypothetical protein
VLKLTEKTYGIDSQQCLQAYTDLGRFYYEMDNVDRCINCLTSALYLADLIGGCFVELA